MKHKPMVYVNRGVQLINAIERAHTLYKRAEDWYDDQYKFRVTISDEDALYYPTQEWLASISDTKKQTVVNVGFNSFEGDGVKRGVQKIYVNDGQNKANFRGSTITFFLKNDVDGEIFNGRDLVILCRSKKVQLEVIEHVESFAKNLVKTERRAVVRTYAKNYWETNNGRLRKFESVVLKAGLAERIVKEVSEFLESEKFYVDRGLPWHRGLLLSGPPGTGKSSLAKGIAEKFNLDVYYLSIADVESDKELIEMVTDIPERSILLLEDIDTFNSVTERKQEKGSVTMSGILNVLDGIVTPHGLLTIMTTNHVERIDPAILRPGRVDMHLTIGMPDKDQVERLFELFYEQKPTVPLDPKKRSVAEITEIFKKNMHDPRAAEKELL